MTHARGESVSMVLLTSSIDVYSMWREGLVDRELVTDAAGSQFEFGTFRGSSTRVAISQGEIGHLRMEDLGRRAVSVFRPSAVLVVIPGERRAATDGGILVASHVHDQNRSSLELEWEARLLSQTSWWDLFPDDAAFQDTVPISFGSDNGFGAVAITGRLGVPSLKIYGLVPTRPEAESANRSRGMYAAGRFAMALAISPRPILEFEAVLRLKTMGHGDRVARTDLLARQAYVESLAELLSHSHQDPDLGGPTVIAIEGAWGSGKSTLMDMTKARLDAAGAWPGRVAGWRRRRVWAWDADLMLRGWFWRPRRKKRVAAPQVLTATYNPWSAQTGEHVWAGLNDCIVATGAPVVARESSSSLQRFWFRHNVEQLDRNHVQRTLRKRVLSPALKLGVFAAPVPVLAQLVRAPAPLRVFGFDVSPADLALWVVGVLLGVGLVHTAAGYLFRRADTLLPAELFGPSGAMGALSTAVGADDPLRDPHRRARKGQLLSAQEDVHRLIRQLGANGTQLVVFIDDLDRCSPRTTADVFEAINGFLSESFPAIRFVLGIDAAATAAHLDAAYSALVVADAGKDAADPSPGWTFLRKLIQLPLPLPRVAQAQVEPLLEGLLGTAPEPLEITAEDVAGLHETATAPVSGSGPAEVVVPVQLAIEALEHDKQVQARFAERLKAQPELSVREAKRIVTVWMFYIRVLNRINPEERVASVRRACHLVLLAEIVARWPASQRNLHRRMEGVHGLRALAVAADDNVQWEIEVKRYELTGEKHKPFRAGLLKILQDYDGLEIAGLAEQLT
ncbi:hypothetical protein Lesp01_38120 [Lentzea sp. NBRC 102530]|nr:hypothetical protein Lesp01_38120 [Lentzea sp. NBRC 102530]